MNESKINKDLNSTIAKARWLTPDGMRLRAVWSRNTKSVWNTERALRIRKQMGRELRLLFINTEDMAEEMRALLGH